MSLNWTWIWSFDFDELSIKGLIKIFQKTNMAVDNMKH